MSLGLTRLEQSGKPTGIKGVRGLAGFSKSPYTGR
jgi:hypothetical protein